MDELRSSEQHGQEVRKGDPVVQIHSIGHVLNPAVGIIEVEEVEEGGAILNHPQWVP